MRCFVEPKAWQGKWIAGFSNVKAGEQRNWLVYLMQVGEAFESHYDLWLYLDTNGDKALDRKSACNSKFGDVYIPKRKLSDSARFNEDNYHGPCNGHRHAERSKKNKCKYQWYKDINYRSERLKRRRPALLVGDLEYSFLWSERKIYLDEKKMRQGQTKYEQFNDFLGKLES